MVKNQSLDAKSKRILWDDAPPSLDDADIPQDDGPGPGALVVQPDDPALLAYLAGEQQPHRRDALRNRPAARLVVPEHVVAEQVIVGPSGERYGPAAWAQFLADAPPEPELTPAQHDDAEFADGLVGSWETYIARIESGYFAKTHVAPYTMPGHGVVYPSCGQFMVSGCVGAGTTELDALTHAQQIAEKQHAVAEQDIWKGRTQVCGRLACPVCFDASIKRAAMAAAKRFFSYLMALRSDLFAEHQEISRRQKRIAQHFVVSVPERDHALLRTPDGYASVKKQVLADLRDLGAQGGFTVYHPWRYGRGLAYAYFSPHFHVVLAGWTDGEQVANLSKWGLAVSDAERLQVVAKDIRRARDRAQERGGQLSDYRQYLKIPKHDRYVYKSVSTLREFLDVFGLARYLLTHCGVQAKKHAVTYWGSCQNRHFRADDVLTSAANCSDAIHRTLEKYSKGDLVVEQADFELWAVENHDVKNAARVATDDAANDLDTRMVLDDLVGRVADPPPQTLDNAPKAQSDQSPQEAQPHYIVGRLRLRDGTGPAQPPSKEKCSTKEVVFVWYLDDSVDTLCPVCLCPLRSLVLTGQQDWCAPTGPGPPDDVAAVCLELAGDVTQKLPVPRGGARYVEPGDYLQGLPYYSVDLLGQVRWQLDVGVAQVGPWYADQPAEVQKEQDAEVEQTRWARVVKEAKTYAVAEHLPVFYRSDDGRRFVWNFEWLNQYVAEHNDVLPPIRLDRRTATELQPLTSWRDVTPKKV